MLGVCKEIVPKAIVYDDEVNKGKGMFLYSAVSSPLGRSKRLILARVSDNTSHDVVILFVVQYQYYTYVANRKFGQFQETAWLYFNSFSSDNVRTQTCLSIIHRNIFRVLLILELWSPRQVTYIIIPLCGIFYFPWHI